MILFSKNHLPQRIVALSGGLDRLVPPTVSVASKLVLVMNLKKVGVIVPKGSIIFETGMLPPAF